MVGSDRNVAMAAKQAALKAFGARLQEARSNTSLTQEDVADKLTVSTQTVRNWEAGRTEPSRSDKERLASLYNKPVEWFFSEEADSSPDSKDAVRQPGLPPVSVCRRLRQARTDLEMTIEDAAHLAGLAAQMLRRYETRQRELPESVLSTLAEIYNRSVDWFWEDDPEFPPLTPEEIAANRELVMSEPMLALRAASADLDDEDMGDIADYIRFVRDRDRRRRERQK